MPYSIRTYERGIVEIHGYFDTLAAPAVVAAANIKGGGFTVECTGVGVYDITFTDTFNDHRGFQASLERAVADDFIVQVTSWTAATRILKLTTVDVSGGAAAHVTVNDAISFVATFKSGTT